MGETYRMSADVTSELAQEALRTVLADTERAQTLARAVLARPDITEPARMTALFALGRSHVELGEPAAAIPHLESALGLASQLGDDDMRSLISSRLAVALFEGGRADDALALLDDAVRTGSDQARGTALNAQGIIRLHRGELPAGKEAFDRAVELLEAAGDTNMIVRSLASRSAAEARLGDFAAAEADLERSTALAESLGLAAIVAGNLHNLGYVRSQRGLIPEALDAYQQARAGYAAAGAPARAIAILETDAAETLLAAGLHEEALEAAERTLADAHASAHVIQEAESELLRARILLSAERLADCVDAAERATALFERSDRGPWANQARYLRLQAQADDTRSLDELRSIVDELDAHGWDSEVQHLLTLLSRSLLEAGDTAGASAALDRATEIRAGGTALAQVALWHGQALLRLAEDDSGGARRALRRGLTVLDEHRAALGATELRVQAGRHAIELCQLGLTLARDDGRPADALRWIERGRAQALRFPPTRPPRDDTLATELAELRRLHADARTARLDGDDPADVDARIATLERRVRDHVRLARGERSHSVSRIEPKEIRDRLGARTLVELFELDGRVGATVVDRSQVRLVDLADTAQTRGVLDDLLFGLRRLAARRGSAAALDAAAAGLHRSAAELDELLAPALSGGADLIVVPSPTLQPTPWQLLPSITGRAVMTTPSALLWMRPPQPRTDMPSARFVAGPGLPAAVTEVQQLHEMYPSSEVLVGPAATAEASLAAAASADLLHIAAHGTFRDDSPMFSALHLADGPLTVYDIERLESVPDTVVLSACHAAAVDASVGNEVMGTAMALVGMGVRSVVAPLVAVADDATATAMVGLHAALLAGQPPHQALARMVDDRQLDDPTLAATAAAFVVISSDTEN